MTGPASKNRIICVGNRHIEGDDLGPRVHDMLREGPLPEDTEIMDGGLCGIDLMGAVQGAGRVVFVDSIEGFGPEGEVVILSMEEVAGLAKPGFGHSSGIPFLLKMLPAVSEGPMPEISVIGAGGPVGEASVARTAKACLGIIEGREGE